ncbi:multidrug effflux MFS transporter [Desulfonatronovibrio hydrogenovorans]|uniref:multidrug effflux MFS transporter n=1 Tax=Desulfonatronovibrio hydrogenovorans TaxID=53245 RepID=UPI00049153BB|nr:multidrug effflux MFS transporter [Desulfonatronovibrio hydrogenovorans]
MKKWIALLALLAAFPPLSTDMYLPAIPSLAEMWQEPLWVINLTLVGFFVTYSIFLLIYGPLSDRFGRKPVLKAGILIYVLASMMCALSSSSTGLIMSRMLQAAGAASAASLALAVVRDVFEETSRERALAYISMVVALAPMLAPIIGGWILAFLPWNWIFAVLAGLGLIALAGVVRMEETLCPQERTRDAGLLTGYALLLKNRRYISLALVVSIGSMPLFAFIAASSDIYISGFGLSEQVYGYFFGFNALAVMAGAFTCIRLTRHILSRNILSLGFAGVAGGGIWLLLGQGQSPWDLALPMFVMSFSLGLSRPPSHNLVLKQAGRGAGAASSFLMFSLMTSGAAAMGFISLEWQDKIEVLGLLAVLCAGLGLTSWLLLQKYSSRPWQ